MDLMTLARRAESTKRLAALPLKLRLWWSFQKVKGMADWSAAQVMDHFFQRPEIKALYTAILADFVVLPSEFPGLGIPATNVETAFDKRIPLQVSRPGRGRAIGTSLAVWARWSRRWPLPSKPAAARSTPAHRWTRS